MGKKTKEDERRKRHGEEDRDKDYGFGWTSESRRQGYNSNLQICFYIKIKELIECKWKKL